MVSGHDESPEPLDREKRRAELQAEAAKLGINLVYPDIEAWIERQNLRELFKRPAIVDALRARIAQGRPARPAAPILTPAEALRAKRVATLLSEAAKLCMLEEPQA
jgi:uncharacterized ferritin-like protein (DUF455 family)